MIKEIKRVLVHLFSGYFSQLLVFLLLLFLFRPFNRGPIYTAIWQFFFTGVLITSLFNAHHPKKIKILCICLGVPALLLNWTTLLFPIESVAIASLLFTFLFMLISTGSIVVNVILRAKVTLETLRGVICAYFMIGFAFSFAYLLIEYVRPESFHLITEAGRHSFFYYSRFLSQMMYFSFQTLLTVGFGDITPVADFAQTVVIFEGIVGQFYIAILVSRLVAVYSYIAEKQIIKEIEADVLKLKKKLPKKQHKKL